MEELSEYHALVAQSARCPLYTLMRTWVSSQYDELMLVADDLPMAATIAGPAIEVKCLNYAYDGGSPQLKDASFSFPQGARIIVVGANGAGKSTLLSILGGKKMVRRGMARILGYDCFNDPAVSQHVMYVGDWWRTSLLMNPTIAFLLGDAQKTSRCQNLIGILRVDLNWKINELSDGQRRRCQLLEILSVSRSVYFMDEITSDLDVVVREAVLAFLRTECESRGATIVYCSHIFDHLEGWATHMLHLSEGSVVRACGLDEIDDYSKLIANGDATPLYSLVRQWIYTEYDGSRANATDGAQKWRKLDTSLDGRRPNLGLAGPMQTHSG
jgi:CCR4-NOT complex subunit CAF16